MSTPKKSRPPCRHCGERYPSRPGGACWVCFEAGLVQRSVTRSRFAVRGLGIVAPTKPASEPCGARPGSEPKVAAMERRLARGENLWHPGDGEGE